MPAIDLSARQVDFLSFTRLWCGILLAGLACLAVSMWLPFDPYIGWQQARGTQMFHGQWIYERLHFDHRPIEVALVGSSRLESGISPAILSEALEAHAGRPVAVANLSIVMPGRDIVDKIVADLLVTHPEVRLIILSDDGDVTNSHPLFAQTATPTELAAAPWLVNLNYLPNLLALPFRNLSNAAQMAAPALFGVRRHFSEAEYLGADLDRTLGYSLEDGRQVNGDIRVAPAALLAMSRSAVARQEKGLRLLGWLPAKQRLAVDRHYLGSILRRAHSAHVAVAFLSLPLYGPVQAKRDRRVYADMAPLIALDGLATHSAYYQSAAHLNRSGAVVASRALARAIAPMLEGDDGPVVAHRLPPDRLAP